MFRGVQDSNQLLKKISILAFFGRVMVGKGCKKTRSLFTVLWHKAASPVFDGIGSTMEYLDVRLCFELPIRDQMETKEVCTVHK